MYNLNRPQKKRKFIEGDNISCHTDDTIEGNKQTTKVCFCAVLVITQECTEQQWWTMKLV